MDTETLSNALTRCNQALEKQVHRAGSGYPRPALAWEEFLCLQGLRRGTGASGILEQGHRHPVGPELCLTLLGREETKKESGAQL